MKKLFGGVAASLVAMSAVTAATAQDDDYPPFPVPEEECEVTPGYWDFSFRIYPFPVYVPPSIDCP